MAAIALVLGTFFWLLGSILGFIQPVLIPVAFAMILAYLLDPLVNGICKWRSISRTMAVTIVFSAFILFFTFLMITFLPEILSQLKLLVGKLPELVQKARVTLTTWIDSLRGQEGDNFWFIEAEHLVRQNWTSWGQSAFEWAQAGVGGFLGWTGFLFSMLLVPLYLFFFLKHSKSIALHWSDYVPLRASRFRDELVSLLTEINGYIINFFRGQLTVSIVDGVMTGLALYFIVKLPYALVVALLAIILGIIPYIGIVLALIPALLIAAAEFGDWQHPLMVLVIFLFVQNFNGIFVAPKILGDSVGLHPMTVIFSVIAWSFVLQGLLGALLAVPLSATIKVLFRRYIWERGQHFPTSSPV